MAKAPFLSRFLTPSLPLVSAGDIALVTGVTSGIGQATAAALVQQGFRVIGTSRTPDSEKSVANAPRGVELVPLDLEDPASIAAVPEHLAALGVDASNPVTVLVNNAGE